MEETGLLSSPKDLKDDEEMRQMISQDSDFYLLSSIYKGNNQRYTGVHKLDRDGNFVPGTGVNLGVIEWKTFVINFSRFKDMINNSSSEKKLVLNTKKTPNNNVFLYKWEWSMNGVPLIEHNKKSGEFFTEKEARDEGKAFLPEDDGEGAKIFDWESLKLDTTRKSVEAPDVIVHMRTVYLFLLQKYIASRRISMCSGCDIDAPGQRDHMIMGNCLDVEFDNDLLLDEAITAIQFNQLRYLFENSRSLMGCKPIFSHLLTRAAKGFIPRNEISQNLKEGLWDQGPLYQNVKNTFDIIGMNIGN